MFPPKTDKAKKPPAKFGGKTFAKGMSPFKKKTGMKADPDAAVEGLESALK